MVIYNPNSFEQLSNKKYDGMIMEFSKTNREKLWLSIEKILNDILLIKEDKIQIILDRLNYKSLSYWERLELIKYLKQQTREGKHYEVFKSLKDTLNTQYTKQIKITKELKTFTFLKNIFGNNSTEKPNN
jgi:alpha-glucosidase (family GH31 glycosyl hydrolase)